VIIGFPALRNHGSAWDQFAALLPDRPVYDLLTRWAATGPGSPAGSSSKKLIQVLRFGCSYEPIADCGCSATTIRERRDEWDQGGAFREAEDDRPGVL